MADQAKGGQGNYPDHALCLPAGMPRMMIAFRPMEFVITPDTTYILIGGIRPLPPHLHRRPRLAEGHRADLFGLLDRQMDRSPTATARYDVLEVETRGLQGPARLRRQRPAAAPRQPDHLQGADLSRQGRSEHPARRDHGDRQCADAALDRDKRYRREPESAPGLARGLLRRGQRADRHRQGELFPERRRPSDADPQGSAAAGPALFQADAEVTPGRGRPQIWSNGNRRVVTCPAA